MNRNIILYILIALLVVVGGTWYALSTRSIDEGAGNDLTEEDQDADMDDEGGESDNEDADGGSASNGSTDTGTGTSVNGGTSDDSIENGGTVSPGTGGGESNGDEEGEVGVGGSETLSPERQQIASELNLQLEIVGSIVTIIGLQLENGDMSVDDASNLLVEVTEVVDLLEDTVEMYLAL
ncbi:MAG: hypothetical protein WDZ74_01800 [Candidatus Paceibacterota bacterium]